MTNEQKKARHREYCRVHREKHRERIRLQSAKSQAKRRARDSATLNKRTAEWRAKNVEHIRAYKKAWKAAHRVEETLAQQARHTKTKGKIIKEDIENWHSRICGICNKLIEADFHIDHKTPLAKGGLHVVENLQLAHSSCNLKKRDKLDFRL